MSEEDHQQKQSATEKPSLRAKLFGAYREYVLEHGNRPASVYKFCKDNGIEEQQFYEAFASLDALEGEIWAQLIRETRDTVEADEDYRGYPVRQKVLAFHYTLLEYASQQRSFMLERFPGLKPGCRSLRRMENVFADYAENWIDEGTENGEIAKRRNVTSWYPQAFTLVMLFVLDHWLKDESERFERTDALIEKGVTLVFDLIRTQALDSAFDLLRFFGGRDHDDK